MSGAAAIANGSAPGRNSIKLIYNTNGRHLALDLKSGTQSAEDEDPANSFQPTSVAPKGIIINPSSLSAAKYLNLDFFFGITEAVTPPGNATPTHYDISIVSPIYKPLDKTELVHTKSIAACSSTNAAWLYYLGGTDADSVQLKEYRLSEFNVSSMPETGKIRLGSSLAAYWNPSVDGRFVIYQDANNDHLYEYDFREETVHHIKNSTDAREGTSLGVTYYEKKVYLYYTDSSNGLRKIVNQAGGWGTSGEIPNTDKVDPAGQLAVITSDKTNHIFYITASSYSGQFVHVRDPVSS